MLPTPSDEQRTIITSMRYSNGICNAVAGAGKTTLIMHLCQAYSTARVQVLTYNRALRDGTTAMVAKLEMEARVKCHTYHGLLQHVSGQPCRNDVQFMDLVDAGWTVPPAMDFDVLVIDETQDVRRHHMRLIQKLLAGLQKTDAVLLVVGDVGQRLYGFFRQNPADSRFLIHADVLLRPFTTRPFVRHQLTVSYRTTPHIANFVNFVTRTEASRSKIVAGNHRSPNRRVHVIVDFPSGRSVVDAVEDAVQRHGPENVMLLANSLNNNGVRGVVNALAGRIKFHVQSGNRSDPFIMKGKVAVNTYCGAKGLERKAVFVFAISSASFYYETDVDPNQVYVALTRACGGELTVVQDHRIPLFPGFGSMAELEQLAEVHHVNTIDQNRTKRHERKRKSFRVGQLTDYVDTVTLKSAVDMIGLTKLRPPTTTDEFKSSVRFGATVEDVGRLVETSLKFALELQHTGKIKAVAENILDPILAEGPQQYGELFARHGDRVIERCDFDRSFPSHRLERVKTLTEIKQLSLVEIAELAAAHNGFGAYHHIMSQVNSFEWAKNIPIHQPFGNMINAPKSNHIRFFEPCSFTGAQDVAVVGRADMLVGSDDAWTFKWNDHLRIEDVLEAAVTTCLTGAKTGKLYNMRTDEMLQLDIADRQRFLEFMVSAKTATSTQVGDEEFLLENSYIS